MAITTNTTAIEKTEHDGHAYYTTTARGVEYCAHFMESAGKWFVSTRRLALGRGNGGGASNKANKVVVTLTDADLYDVRFLTIRGVNMTERGTVEGVHADRLAAVFTEQTGFDTHM